MCTNFVDSSNPSAQNPCKNFVIPPENIDNGFNARVDTSAGLCESLRKLPGGGCPSSAQILQTGSCVFGTISSVFGGCCVDAANSIRQVVRSSDGYVLQNPIFSRLR